jgi:hypothetical protein
MNSNKKSKTAGTTTITTIATSAAARIAVHFVLLEN